MIFIKTIAVIIFVSIGMVTALAPTPAEAAGWKCAAKRLKNSSYKGGKTAYIHLSPYNNGGSYKVTKVSSTKVTGKTKDGTPFTCKKN
jgi:hypothetical protein